MIDKLDKNGKNKKVKILQILAILNNKNRNSNIALKAHNTLEILIATMLSAQCTDKQVNEVTKSLFKKYYTVEDYANADLKILEQDIKSTGFYHNKAKNIKSTCKMLIEKFGSKVPSTMKELIMLPGVARKTANIVLANAFGVIEGIAVDTHVLRLSQRLGLTENKDRNKVEKDLMEIVPRDMWKRITSLLILHGRQVCKARKPNCDECALNMICPSAFSFNS
jgi:endonuclease-3